MRTTEFEERKRNLAKYFTNRKRWKENEYGDIVFYKGKRNLKELKNALDLVFGDTMQGVKEEYIKDDVGVVIGGSVSFKIYVDADFIGAYQGTQGAEVYIKYSLLEHAFFCNQADSFETLEFYA